MSGWCKRLCTRYAKQKSSKTQGGFDPEHCELACRLDKLRLCVQMLEDALGNQAKVAGVLEIGGLDISSITGCTMASDPIHGTSTN